MKFKKFISSLLAISMVFATVSASALADDTNENTQVATTYTSTEQEIITEEFESILATMQESFASVELAQNWENVGLINVPFSDTAKSELAYESIQSVKISATTGDVMKAILTLKSLGYDPTKITAEDGTEYDAIVILGEMANVKEDYYIYTAPYTLLAFGDYEGVSQQQIDDHIELLTTSLGDETLYEWGVDTPLQVIQGLAPYYEKADVKQSIDDSLEKIETTLATMEGTFNACTDAMIILTYTMLGKDPAEVLFNDGVTNVVDDFRAMMLPDYSGFLGWDNISFDEYSTRQGLLALQNLVLFNELQIAINPFDLTGFAVESINEIDVKPDDNTGSGDNNTTLPSDDISINFTVKDNDRNWFTEVIYTNENATIATVFYQVFDIYTDYSYEIDGGSYVKSITHPTYGVYDEFGSGANSGWKYTLNGEASSVPFNVQTLEDGDNVEWYYVTDYENDTTPNNTTSNGSNEENKIEEPEISGEKITIKVNNSATVDDDGNALVKISESDVNEAIENIFQAVNNSENSLEKVLMLNILGTDDATSIETILTRKTVNALNENIDFVTIETPFTSIILSKDVLENISSETDEDIKIKVEKVQLDDLLSEENKVKIGDNTTYDLTITSGEKIINELGGAVEILIPYELKNEENPYKLVVFCIDDDGIIEEIDSVKYDAQRKEIAFLTEEFSQFVVAYDVEKQIFDDVFFGDWYEEAVSYVVANGLFGEISNEIFEPNSFVKREDILKILYDLSEEYFSLNDENSYQNELDWAVKNGISDGENPEDKLTREQFMTIIWRCFGEVEPENGLIDDYSDYENVSYWAEKAMNWAVGNGVMQGKNDEKLDPKSYVTRAEVATILMRITQI